MNFILFQVAWFACVAGGSVTGAVVGSAVLLIHFLVISRDIRELRLIAIGALIGCFADQILLLCGLLITSQQGVLIPCWLIFLWLAFMTCIRHSIGWMQDKPLIAAVGGAIFAPLSYYAGVRLGAIEFGHRWLTPLVIGLIWAGFMPLAFFLSSRLMKNNKKVNENHE